MNAMRLIVLAATALLGAGHDVAAAAFEVDGLIFSDEEGGFQILSVSGHGTLEDPFVVVEEIIDNRPAALVIRGLSPAWGNRIPTNHPAGFVLRKVVINRTDLTWDTYDQELQIERGIPSDIYDGLSFGQASDAGRPFRSDRFAQNTTEDEPRDFINFHDGEVPPGDLVMFEFVITATSSVEQFYIVQDPNRPIAALPVARRPRKV
ncbi:MAG: hypothetical protein EXQ94_14320 [Alphaproteobacteria bacterium]|nr:hypothetical protein [Alphaproteobacteria bacterium]